jgi:hypothetical protein
MGICYKNMGQFKRAVTMIEEDRNIAEQVGDRAQVAEACGLLGICQLQMGEYITAAAYAEKQFNIATELGLGRQQASASLAKGVALRLHAACAGGQGGLSREVSLQGAEQWLQCAWNMGEMYAALHLALLFFDVGEDDKALTYLKEHLAWRVQRGRDVCNGCGQKRGEDAPMLTCSGCGVARFCSGDHQKMASKSAASGGNILMGRHKVMCVWGGRCLGGRVSVRLYVCVCMYICMYACVWMLMFMCVRRESYLYVYGERLREGGRRERDR